jgi:phosphotransferase system  glucose/maltose/N-acetylglucosamine-specific IIC component
MREWARANPWIHLVFAVPGAILAVIFAVMTEWLWVAIVGSAAVSSFVSWRQQTRRLHEDH